MAARLLLAPVGAGKTETVLRHIARTLDSRPFARVWVILATKRQGDAFRQRLTEWDDQRHVYFNVEFFNFYELYERLLDAAGQPQRQLGDSSRFALLRTITTRLQPDLEVYGSIAQTPGFIRIMADFIYELKQSLIYPEDFAAAAETARDRDLARIYAEYQQTLQVYNLVDKEGEGWLAVNALRDNVTLVNDLAALLVDGFDQFTPVQADLLALLADRTEETLITLTTAPGRDTTIGRRFLRAQAVLQERMGGLFVTEIERHTEERPPLLQHVIDTLFLRGAAPMPIGDSEALTMIEAPTPAEEVGAVLRQVKRLLLAGTPPDDVLVVLRDWERYRVHFSRYSRKYKLPLALHYGEPLHENPAIIALLDLITLHETRFQRRRLLDVLRSQYITLPFITPEEVDLLEKISLRYTVVNGRAIWLEAIAQASRTLAPDREHEEDIPALLNAEHAEHLRANLSAFFDAVTPPERATVSAYVAWLENLIGEDVADDPDDELDTVSIPDFTLRMVNRLREDNVPENIIARDLAAMHELKRALRGLLNAQELLRSIDPTLNPITDWATFSRDLTTAIEQAAIDPRPNRAGRVLVTTASDARGLPHPHVFILGLSEGLFPARTSEDPLYLDSERRALQARNIPLQTRAERSADDGLFYELICLPHVSLTLSRPTLEEGKEWLESPLWRAVCNTLTKEDREALLQRERIGIGQVVLPEKVAAVDEAAMSAAARLSSGDASAWPLVNWLRQSMAWAHVEIGRQIEMGRITGDSFDHYSGRLRDEMLRQVVARRLSPMRVWSASQLNEYAECGYRFFAGRLLKLEKLEEPEEGMDAAQRGTLNHAILERTYRHLREEGVQIIPDNVDIGLYWLREAAAHVFRDAPEKIGFRATALWEQEQTIILRKLEQAVWLDFSPDGPISKAFGEAPRVPFILEAPFGIDDVVIVPLEGGSLRVRGYIDRIDRQGRHAVVVDYKTGSTPIPLKEMTTGRNFQMMVYLEAARAILARESELDLCGGLFWHLSNQKASGQVHLEDDGEEALNTARLHLSRHIARGRQADFAIHASKPENGRCTRYCEFSELCRMGTMNRRRQ
ncbi:MAG: hypothetical protein OHK0046_30710 [Anaerolineae bacterium]